MSETERDRGKKETGASETWERERQPSKRERGVRGARKEQRR